jgi:hypothetical protein
MRSVMVDSVNVEELAIAGVFRNIEE